MSSQFPVPGYRLFETRNEEPGTITKKILIMFKRFSNKQLLLALAVLVVLYMVSFAFGGSKNGSFQKILATLDTAQVSKITIVAPKAEGPFSLNRAGNRWQLARDGGKTANVDPAAISNALAELSRLEATQLVSNSSDSWAEYQVDDATGTKITTSGGGDPLDIVVGRFEYKQMSGGMTSYVRKAGEDEVYLVKGFFDALFNREASAWRNKTLIKGNASDWMNLTFNYPGMPFQLFKGSDNVWRMPDSTAVDQSQVSSYLSTISNLAGTNFVDEIPSGSPLMRVEVANATGQAISLNAFPRDTTYVINSTANPESYFDGAEGDLFNKVFVPKERFVLKGALEVR